MSTVTTRSRAAKAVTKVAAKVATKPATIPKSLRSVKQELRCDMNDNHIGFDDDESSAKKSERIIYKSPEVATFPANFYKTLDNIRRIRAEFEAPVDSQGCAKNHQQTASEKEQRYQILTSLMLSSQTKDQITFAAGQRLQQAGCGNVDGMLKTSENDIEDLIKPVGFYRRKAIYLKKTAAILKQDYDGDIPDSIDKLTQLPGVGPKMAYLCMTEAWNKVLGIGVDTHVHRIAGRLKWAPYGLKDPEHTRKYLESWMPRELWREINHLLVGFGQTVCLPVYPKCDICYNKDICPSAFLKKSKKACAESSKKRIKIKPKVETQAHQNDETTSDQKLNFDSEFKSDPIKVKVEY